MVAGALEGVLVADFSRVLAGPYATMLLADLGADVVKVERPGGGDDTRAWGPPWTSEGESTYFLGVNRNKRSLAVDLTSEEGLRTARELAARADVVVENFKPGGLDRLGLGYDALRIVNPGVVYASITGFGRTGGADLPGYDLVVQAVGGLMSVTGPVPGEPTKVGVALVDVVTGLHAAVGILAALRHRERTGEGQRVEVNLLSSLLSALVNQASGYVAGGVVPGIMGNRHPSIAPYEVFPTADRPLVLAVGNDGQFRALCRVLGRPDLVADPDLATNPGRVSHRERLYAELSAALAARPADAWFEALSAAGVPCGPINDVGEAVALAGSLGLDPVVDAGGVPSVAHPVRLSATPAAYRRRPPGLGGDDDELAAWLARPPGRRVSFRRPPTAQEAVLGELRMAIVRGDLLPGQQILQDQLAERFGVSRVPLREALKILEGEGAVSYVPHRGYFVAELSLADLEEVYRLRELLEEEAVRVAVPLLDDDALDRLDAAADGCERAAAAGDVAAMTEANRLLHFTLYDAAHRPRLVRLIRILWDATDAYRSLYYGGADNRDRVSREHRAVLAAVRARDADLAVRLLAEHREHAVAHLRGVLGGD